MATGYPRPDLVAYNVAVRMTPAQLVTALRELLGAKLVAYRPPALLLREGDLADAARQFAAAG